MLEGAVAAIGQALQQLRFVSGRGTALRVLCWRPGALQRPPGVRSIGTGGCKALELGLDPGE